jgi:ribosomal protein S6--L-glutamate ligase
MRFAVLASPNSWYLKDLRRAAGARHEIVCVCFDQIRASLDADGQWSIDSGSTCLNDFDAVLVRTMPPGSLEQVVFRMDALGRLANSGVIVINPPRAVEAAVDKYLASAKLQAAGLPTPRTLICQTAEDAMTAFGVLGGDVVVKPLFGSEGRGILRVDDPALALRTFRALAQLNAVIYVQEFVRHNGYDIRLFVLGDQVLAMRRLSDSDWRTNVSRGARTEPYYPDHALVDIARRASAAIGAPLAGVDLLPDQSGGYFVLEVNAVPGWKALSRTLGVDVASEVLDYVQHLVASRTSTS